MAEGEKKACRVLVGEQVGSPHLLLAPPWELQEISLAIKNPQSH